MSGMRAIVAVTVVLAGGLVSGAHADTLTVSGIVVRADTQQNYGGAPLGVYPALGGSLGRIANGISLENGIYTVQKENVFLSSVWVVYEGTLYSADPIRVDLSVNGTTRIGQAQDLRLIPRPAPQVAGMAEAATYLAAEVRSATVLAKSNAISAAVAQEGVLRAARRAVSTVPAERAAELHELFRKEVGPPTAGAQPVQSPTLQEFAQIAAAVPIYERRPDERSEVARNCEDCKEGEAKAETTLTVPHGLYVDINDPPCVDRTRYGQSIPLDVKARVAKAYYAGGQHFALSLDDDVLNRVPQVDGAGDIAKMLRTLAGQPQVASCTRLVVVVPKTAEITRIEKSMNCPAGGWCALAGAGEHAVEDIDENLRAVSVVAKNWSHDKSATGTLRVFYRR